nr:immunoglobulin heavy chain junction region [Macaca mulatta]MOX59694.1 immunoglobulin heavy chain junction region [Macaca mulatta]MOX59978.1 immunoglobulin heavy chain junction region [Macaca mulatta]MOX68389.1 immunoglobulin heavy chain junction region [Macaca mulatta]
CARKFEYKKSLDVW